MFKRSGRFAASLRLVMGCAVFSAVLLTSSGPVIAALPSSGSVTIVAAVAPVRYILVNDNDKITEVLSNSQTAVTPIVYRNKFNTAPVALSPAIRSQYVAIMAHVNTNQTGVVYQLRNNAGKRPASLFGRIRLDLY